MEPLDPSSCVISDTPSMRKGRRELKGPGMVGQLGLGATLFANLLFYR